MSTPGTSTTGTSAAGALPSTVDRRMRAVRTSLILIGTAGLLFGLYVLFDTVRLTRLPGVALWIGAAIVLHDAVLAPLVFFSGILLRRAGRRVAGTIVLVVQGAIVVGSIMTLIVVPAIVAKSLSSNNPSILPLDYGRNLALFWVVVALVATVWSVVIYARSRRANQRPSSRQS
ncbi:hypothetical protein E3T28_07245 [Cryobacterium sinapicolor]|uniref:Uncharacterized protein n=1 Tax=Cryobacterium sinapicolor TaxID=1259236 RepID=A0ABY2J952_9MICO|nr:MULTISPECIES: hypothetical protein [Cryobacterium]TFC86091.1 hypothetical protein E3O67_10775 [Cryobacterium sp. TMT3-29-2]TFD00888.1 hypothetical protein E3T28_07245 [Cryobacterium sinapicolor]